MFHTCRCALSSGELISVGLEDSQTPKNRQCEQQQLLKLCRVEPKVLQAAHFQPTLIRPDVYMMHTIKLLLLLEEFLVFVSHKVDLLIKYLV